MDRNEMTQALLRRCETSIEHRDILPLFDPETVALAASLAAITDADDIDHLDAAYALGYWHWLRHQKLPEGQDREDLVQSVYWLELVHVVDPERVPDWLWDLATGRLAGENPVAVIPGGEVDEDDDEAFALYLYRGALEVLRDPEMSADRGTLAAAAGHLEFALQLCKDYPDRRRAYASLRVEVLMILYNLISDPEVLDQLVGAAREAVALAAPDDRPGVLSILGDVLRLRFRLSHRREDLEEALAVAQAAVTDVPTGHADRGAVIASLAVTYGLRFADGSDMEDLELAVRAARQAAAAISNDDPSAAELLQELVNILHVGFGRTGRLADLEEALSVGQRALVLAHEDEPYHSELACDVAAVWHSQYVHTGRLSDLQEAIRLARGALSRPTGDRPDPGAVATLASLLRSRFERTGKAADLDEAVELHRQAVALMAGAADHALFQADLSDALHFRFRATKARADLREAILLAEEALAAGVRSADDVAHLSYQLSSVLMTEFEHSAKKDSLRRAINAVRSALADAPDDHPARAAYLSLLASELMAWSEVGGGDDARIDAVAAARTAAATDTAPALDRVQMWIWAASYATTPTEAVDAWERAFALLPILVDDALAPADRRHHLSLLTGMASDAAAAAIALGDPARAWRFLEQARGVLIGHALLGRTESSRLRAAHPDLAERAAQLRRILNTEVTMTGVSSGAGEAARRTRAAAEWQDLLATIRSQAGFADYGRPPTLEELRQAVPGGVAVAVNVSPQRCDALILHTDRAEVIPLPALTLEDVHTQADAFITMAHASRERDQNAIANGLRWLWDTTVGPIMDHLGYTATPDGNWPHVWWLPTGLLATLPLHAAGHHDDPPGHARRSVIDRVVSSYTATLSMLRHTSHAGSAHTSAVVVGVDQAPGRRSLAYAEDEASLVLRLLPAAVNVRTLLGPQATAAGVMAALPGAGWAHFACHARAAADPADSHLLLYDGELPVHELAALDLDGGHLAYLSACTTAYAGGPLLDESIHIASALQLAGFRHVVGTLWPMADIIGPEIAGYFYGGLAASMSPAEAVHQAVRSLRQDYPGHPTHWAAHVHYGS